MTDQPSRRTARLDLWRPTPDDLDGLFEIFSDPRVWLHYPSLRHEWPERTRAMIQGWQESWRIAGLGTWVVRPAGQERVIGCGGCTLLHDRVWNLGYRLAADQHGRGYATELSIAAVERAAQVDPGRPVIAYLVAHNRASARVAEKAGLHLAHSLPDKGNPDPSVLRLVYADRPLTPEQLAATGR
jgi:RimJ/RimL family protein N-acetyltransferase